MANSRLEKIGTIFTRTSALLKSGAMRPEDKPIWYDVYKAFPPKLEPRFDRPAPNVEIRPIFYEEDAVRARFHKSVKQSQTITLESTKRQTESQMFIQIYKKLKAQGPLDEEKIFDVSLETLQERLHQERDERLVATQKEDEPVPGLLQRFSQASRPATANEKEAEKVDLKDIFRD